MTPHLNLALLLFGILFLKQVCFNSLYNFHDSFWLKSIINLYVNFTLMLYLIYLKIPVRSTKALKHLIFCNHYAPDVLLMIGADLSVDFLARDWKSGPYHG